MIAISDARMAMHHAQSSYWGSVTPDLSPTPGPDP